MRTEKHRLEQLAAGFRSTLAGGCSTEIAARSRAYEIRVQNHRCTAGILCFATENEAPGVGVPWKSCEGFRLRVINILLDEQLRHANPMNGLLRRLAKKAASPSSSFHRPRKGPSLESLGRRIDPLAERGIDPFS